MSKPICRPFLVAQYALDAMNPLHRHPQSSSFFEAFDAERPFDGGLLPFPPAGDSLSGFGSSLPYPSTPPDRLFAPSFPSSSTNSSTSSASSSSASSASSASSKQSAAAPQSVSEQVADRSSPSVAPSSPSSPSSPSLPSSSISCSISSISSLSLPLPQPPASNPRIINCPHTTRRHEAMGMCKACYDRRQRKAAAREPSEEEIALLTPLDLWISRFPSLPPFLQMEALELIRSRGCERPEDLRRLSNKMLAPFGLYSPKDGRMQLHRCCFCHTTGHNRRSCPQLLWDQPDDDQPIPDLSFLASPASFLVGSNTPSTSDSSDSTSLTSSSLSSSSSSLSSLSSSSLTSSTPPTPSMRKRPRQRDDYCCHRCGATGHNRRSCTARCSACRQSNAADNASTDAVPCTHELPPVHPLTYFLAKRRAHSLAAQQPQQPPDEPTPALFAAVPPHSPPQPPHPPPPPPSMLMPLPLEPQPFFPLPLSLSLLPHEQALQYYLPNPYFDPSLYGPALFYAYDYRPFGTDGQLLPISRPLLEPGSVGPVQQPSPESSAMGIPPPTSLIFPGFDPLAPETNYLNGPID